MLVMWYDCCIAGCPIGFFGQDCQGICSCANGAICNHMTGECKCASGFTGLNCREKCPEVKLVVIEVWHWVIAIWND